MREGTLLDIIQFTVPKMNCTNAFGGEKILLDTAFGKCYTTVTMGVSQLEVVMQNFWSVMKGLLASALNGAATGASTYLAMPAGNSIPDAQQYKIAGSAALAGAIFGGISYILRSPFLRCQ